MLLAGWGQTHPPASRLAAAAAAAEMAGAETGPLLATDVSIFTAIQEQLGLRLERTTDPVPAVLVIDHVERPTLN